MSRHSRNQVQDMISMGLLLSLLALALAACAARPAPTASPPAPSPTAVKPLPNSFKGYELYSWQVNGDWQFTLITGTNRTKTVEEIITGENTATGDGWVRIRVQGVEAIQAVLGRLPAGEYVFWPAQPHLEPGQSQAEPFALPSQEIVAVLQEYCKQLGLRLYVGN